MDKFRTPPSSPNGLVEAPVTTTVVYVTCECSHQSILTRAEGARHGVNFTLWGIDSIKRNARCGRCNAKGRVRLNVVRPVSASVVPIDKPADQAFPDTARSAKVVPKPKGAASRKCSVCGGAIPSKRLQHFSAATRCAPCEGKPARPAAASAFISPPRNKAKCRKCDAPAIVEPPTSAHDALVRCSRFPQCWWKTSYP